MDEVEKLLEQNFKSASPGMDVDVSPFPQSQAMLTFHTTAD